MQLVKNKVRFARLNCDYYHQKCNQAGIQAYPTLMLYNEKKSMRSLRSGIRIRATTAEVIQKELSTLLPKKAIKSHDEL